jgi:hypothetical protein
VAVFASIALGFVLSPPAVFVMVAVLSLLVEGLALVCLWHRDTLAYLAGPWLDGPADESGGESDDGSGGTVPPTAGGADRQDASRDPAQPPV